MADFDPWARVTDLESARLAMRMVGLPVFLMGLIAVLTAGIGVLTVRASGLAVTTPRLALIIAVVGLALVLLLGLAVRAGKAVFLPVAAGLTFANAVLSLWITPLWALPLHLIMAGVALSGLRGWWWLRTHPA